jgi:hypothetical protein
MICIVRHYVLVYVLRSYLPNLIKREKESNQHTVLCQHTHLRLEGTVYLVGVGQYKAKHGGVGYPHAKNSHKCQHTQNPTLFGCPHTHFFLHLHSLGARTHDAHVVVCVAHTKLLNFFFHTRNESFFLTTKSDHSRTFIHFISQSRLAPSCCLFSDSSFNLSKFDANCVRQQASEKSCIRDEKE